MRGFSPSMATNLCLPSPMQKRPCLPLLTALIPPPPPHLDPFDPSNSTICKLVFSLIENIAIQINKDDVINGKINNSNISEFAAIALVNCGLTEAKKTDLFCEYSQQIWFRVKALTDEYKRDLRIRNSNPNSSIFLMPYRPPAWKRKTRLKMTTWNPPRGW